MESGVGALDLGGLGASLRSRPLDSGPFSNPHRGKKSADHVWTMAEIVDLLDCRLSNAKKKDAIKDSESLERVITPEFERHARRLNDVTFSEAARPHYEIMSGALMWDDEKPDIPFSEIGWFAQPWLTGVA